MIKIKVEPNAIPKVRPFLEALLLRERSNPMDDADDLNVHGNHKGEFTQSVGGWAEYAVEMTLAADTIRHDVTLPPKKIIPIIFLPGVMGSNLRLSKQRQTDLERPDNRSWRPDDIVSAPGSVLFSSGHTGWYRNASAAQRQQNFDQDETEVEFYHYTESKQRFDPGGAETLKSDVRHRNVPDNLAAIPPLVGSRKRARNAKSMSANRVASPAQVARWRGWSEVLFDGAYGDVLKTAEQYMNNIIKDNEIHPQWRRDFLVPDIDSSSEPAPKLENLLREEPQAFGGEKGPPISDDELKKIASCWYPVHAMGYNFLKSNAISAEAIAHRICGLAKGYRERGFQCEEVILVTHSMGGLLARALIHPDYGKMHEKRDGVKILGIYHNVMPTMGAAGAYKRMRFGFQEPGLFGGIEASIFAIDGEHATAILANAPAPLEMMPATGYGEKWLKILNSDGNEIWSWPRGGDTSLNSIYLQNELAWWRLINPKWVNPAHVSPENGGGIEKVYRRLEMAHCFLDSITKYFPQA